MNLFFLLVCLLLQESEAECASRAAVGKREGKSVKGHSESIEKSEQQSHYSWEMGMGMASACKISQGRLVMPHVCRCNALAT